MPKPKTAADYEKLAIRRGYVWLGPFPENTKLNTNWRCQNNHEIAGSYGNINQGMSCKKCVLERNAAEQRHSPEDYHALAKLRGVRWIGPLVNSALAQTVWECQEGHRWPARYNSLQSARSGCPICGFERSAAAKRRKSAEYIALANQKEIIWLGNMVKSTKSDTRWRCPTCDHVWLSPFSTISAAKVFPCPNCSPLRPKTEADFHALAQDREFKWVGETLVNTRTNTLWECQKCGYQWPAPYSNILGGSGCPECLDMVNGKFVSKPQRKLAEMVGGKLNEEKVGRFTPDVVKRVEDIQIAIEYDSWFIHGADPERDKKRDEFFREAGWRVLRVRSNKMLPTKSQLDDAIQRLIDGELWVDILLEDWGDGETCRDIGWK